MKKLSLSFYVASLLVILGLIVLRTTLQLPFSTRIAAMGGPATFPTAYLAIIIGFSAILAITEFIKSFSASESKPSSKAAIEVSDVIRILMMIVAVAVYISTLRMVGFMISTPLLTLALLWLFGYRHIIISPLLAIGFTILLRLLFQTFLRVLLPGGYVIDFLLQTFPFLRVLLPLIG